MEELLVAVLSMFLVVALIPLYLWKRRQDSQPPPHHDEPPQAPRREAVVRTTATRRMRRRPAASGASTSADPPATVEESDGESDDEAAGGGYYEAKASKKKETKRQEREAQRQADEAARESKQAKQDRYSEMRRLKDEEREAQERMLEEEAKAQKAKEEEAAALEFEKWKGEFSVDEEGTLEEAQDSAEDLLTNFVEYIKKHKCVPLEELAAEFKLRTQECINRITSLESMGRLSGVMDDRGKFIYISQEEMKAVADYIKRQGRVSISHLASKSNQFIDLEPKVQYTDDINIGEEITVN
ncbi:DDRGK domain-containing protein 1 [Vigna radiata var. radiata]|uniref:DDRGK domain-containing protein 1 n=1 Tax=Vigna radiata var. radiata TaxID=3916 RepID=A0A1S3VUK9_VIGRR|nr:DDRGK domain-containing protein 1 [Vigna radiata var. radiata]